MKTSERIPGPFQGRLTPQIDEALSQSKDVLTARSRLNALISQTQSEVPRLHGELAVVTQRLDIEASNENATVEELSVAKKAVNDARDRLEVAEARLRGLDSRLREADDLLINTSSALAAAARDFNGEMIQQFRKERFLPAVGAFAQALREAHALLTAVGARTENLLAIEVFDIDPETYRQRLARLQEQRWIPERNTTKTVQTWTDFAECQQLFEIVDVVRNSVDELQRMASEAMERRKGTAPQQSRAASQ
jgi:hypothetical protein